MECHRFLALAISSVAMQYKCLQAGQVAMVVLAPCAVGDDTRTKEALDRMIELVEETNDSAAMVA